MTRTSGRRMWPVSIVAAFLLTAPTVSTAGEARTRQSEQATSEERGQFEQQNQRTEQQAAAFFGPDYILVVTPLYVAGDQERSRMERMVQELDNLPTERDREFYRRALQRRGYQITDAATQGNRAQFGARKNGQDMVLTVRFDEDTGKSTQVSAFPLLITAQEGERPGRSQSARRSGGVRQMVQELESLPTGRSRKFYRRALQQRGYQITDSVADENAIALEVEKNGQPFELSLTFDEETGRSTQVEASPIRQAYASRPAQLDPAWREARTSRERRQRGMEQQARRGQEERRGGVAQQGRRGRSSQIVQELEALPVGRSKQFYRQALQKRGYQNIQTTLNTEDTLHLEAEKNGQPVTLAVSFDQETGQSTEVAAAVTGRGERSSRGEMTSSVHGKGKAMRGEAAQRMRYPQRFSDRDQLRAARLVKELEGLPVGEHKRFYRQTLQQHGYEITDTTTWNDHVKFEVEKNGQPLALTVYFDDRTGESSQIEAAPLWWDTAQKQTPRKERFRDAEQRGKFDQAGAGEMIQEIEALPVGRERRFYLKTLAQRGYRIPATYIDTENQLQLEAVKDGQRAVVTVKFDDTTGRSTDVYAAPLGQRGSDTSRMSRSLQHSSGFPRDGETGRSAERPGRQTRAEWQAQDDY